MTLTFSYFAILLYNNIINIKNMDKWKTIIEENNRKNTYDIEAFRKEELERRLKRQDEIFVRVDELIDFVNDYKKSKKMWFSLENELKTVFAIAKAERSKLTYEDARKIYNKYKETSIEKNDEFLAIIKKEIEDAKSDIEKISYAHDKLEFYNVLNAIKFIRTSNKKLYNEVKENWVTKELLLKLHSLLTKNMDELFLGKNLKHYSPYFSWQIRSKNNIRVWWWKVRDFNLIEAKINEINKLSLDVKDFYDIWNIHGVMYMTHIFSNGNKRVSRCIEIILIRLYFPKLDIFPLSTGYFFNNNAYLSTLCYILIAEEDISRWKQWHQWFFIVWLLEFLYEIFKIELDDFLLKNDLWEFVWNIPYQNVFRKENFEWKNISFEEFVSKMMEKWLIVEYKIPNRFIINREKISKNFQKSIFLIDAFVQLIYVSTIDLFWENRYFNRIKNN